jgi:protein TonB
MMIRTAGGPGLVSPIDFHERRTPRLSSGAWVAIGIVAAAHVAVGIGLYYQRIELRTPPATITPTPPIDVTMLRPPPPPEPAERRPAAANPPLNRPDVIVPSDVEPLPAPPLDAEPAPGPTLTFDREVREPVVHAPPAAEPTPPPARVIRNPSWSRQPDAEQMMRAYPRRALEAGLGGSATLDCMVQANGSVAVCHIAGETPAGQGFGRAAQQLSRHFRINPRTVDGTAEGTRVSINLRFVPPPAD